VSLLPVFRRFFQVPYDVTPLFATLTKTAGCIPFLPRMKLENPSRAPQAPIIEKKEGANFAPSS
jgi:hypothetical protein